MSTTTDTDGETEYGVDEIKPDTLLPIRISSNNKFYVGNTETFVTRSAGFVKHVVYATAESIVNCNAVHDTDRAVIANLLEDGLEFESYTDEAENRFGRPALQIVYEEGIEAYRELKDKIDKKAFLHAAVQEITVYEAAQELGTNPVLPLVKDGEMVDTIGGGYRDPDLVSGAIVHEGKVVEADLREMTPDMDFVMDNWSDLGGGRKGVTIRNIDDESYAETARQIARDDGGEVDDMMIRRQEAHSRDRLSEQSAHVLALRQFDELKYR